MFPCNVSSRDLTSPDSVSVSACDYRTRLTYVMTFDNPHAHNFHLRRSHVSQGCRGSNLHGKIWREVMMYICHWVAHDSCISNGNRTEWSPIRSVIIRLIRELKQRRRRWQRERQRSNRLRLAKRQLCTRITLFCTFLCRRCTTTTWTFKFCGGRKQKTTTLALFLFLNFNTVL